MFATMTTVPEYGWGWADPDGKRQAGRLPYPGVARGHE